MNKSDLIEAHQKEFGGTFLQSRQSVEFVLDSIKEAVIKGDRVSLGGFGIFTKRPTNARIARNPKTGEKVNIKASNKVKFTPTLEFKNVVAGK